LAREKALAKNIFKNQNKKLKQEKIKIKKLIK